MTAIVSGPTSPQAALHVWVHGGGWVEGSRAGLPPPVDGRVAGGGYIFAAVAALSRRAHVNPGFAGGLPTADAAYETAADVAVAVSAGAQLWTVWADTARCGGRAPSLVGTARVVHGQTAVWRVERVSVDPAWRRGGVARRLIAAIEAAAAREQVQWLQLDAVVERRLATFYGRLGFRIRARWPSPDKALTEATMVRPVGAPPTSYHGPGDGDDSMPRRAVVLVWLDSPAGVYAVCTLSDRPHRTISAVRRRLPGHRGHVIGVDMWPQAGLSAQRAIVRRLVVGGGLRPQCRAAHDVVLQLPGPARAVSAYRMPRLLHPSLLAWWRPLSNPRGESSSAESWRCHTGEYRIPVR